MAAHPGASDERPSVDQYFMDMTHLVKARGTCPRRQVGAVIVKDKRVLTTGYNGAPRNFQHPIDVGCLRDELQIPRGMVADICPCLHAEQNAIIQAATTGVSIDGADLYVTTQPCTQCSRMVANCGIKRVVFEEEYPDPLSIGILTTAKVELFKWDKAKAKAVKLAHANTFEQAQDEVRKRFREGKLSPAPPPGLRAPLPMAVPGVMPPAPQRARLAPAPVPEDLDSPVDDLPAGSKAPIRDLKDDPARLDLIRRMAREKAERRKQAQEDAQR
ncbi:MAG: dCMP deaminase family protein [bacterium]